MLVFLPGWDDISKVHDSLKNARVFSSGNGLQYLLPFFSFSCHFPPLYVIKLCIVT